MCHGSWLPGIYTNQHDLFPLWPPPHLTSCTANEAVSTEAASVMQSASMREAAPCCTRTTGSVGSGGKGQLDTWNCLRGNIALRDQMFETTLQQAGIR